MPKLRVLGAFFFIYLFLLLFVFWFWFLGVFDFVLSIYPHMQLFGEQTLPISFQGLDSMIFVGAFQCRIFCDSMSYQNFLHDLIYEAK